MHRVRRNVRLALAAAGLALTVSACGSKTESGTAAPTTAAPTGATTASAGETGTSVPTEGETYEIVPDAVVTTGLAEVKRHAEAAKASLAAKDQAAAEGHVKEMNTIWFTFEGTIRKNDKNLYLDLEDGIGGIKLGTQRNDQVKLDKGVAQFETASAAYLKAHP